MFCLKAKVKSGSMDCPMSAFEETYRVAQKRVMFIVSPHKLCGLTINPPVANFLSCIYAKKCENCLAVR